jgi:hypothetical protein
MGSPKVPLELDLEKTTLASLHSVERSNSSISRPKSGSREFLPIDLLSRLAGSGEEYGELSHLQEVPNLQKCLISSYQLVPTRRKFRSPVTRGRSH